MRLLSATEAYARATPAQRAYWFGGPPPLHKEAIPYQDVHGGPPPAAASWDSRPGGAAGRVDAGEVLGALDALAAVGADLDRRQTVELVGEVADQAAADLFAWHLRQPRPDPTAPLPLSQAERRRRELADAELARQGWRL